jgi:hypothetical protein
MRILARNRRLGPTFPTGEERAMADAAKRRPLIYRCPETGIDIITRIFLKDPARNEILFESPFLLQCSCCGRIHVFHGRDCRTITESAA